MTPTELDTREILNGCMVARLCTMSSGGRPHVNPIYFVLDDGTIRAGTATGTLAARNVVANPNVQILFEIESRSADRRLLRVTGDAVVLTDPEVLRDYRRRDAQKYFRSMRGLWMSLTHIRQLFLTRRYLGSADPGTTHCVIEVNITNSELLMRPAAPSSPV